MREREKGGGESGQQYPIDHPTNLPDERGTSYPTIVARLGINSLLRDRGYFSTQTLVESQSRRDIRKSFPYRPLVLLLIV